MPRHELVLVERVAEAEQRHRVAHLLEAARGLGADALRGRVRRHEVRALGLQGEQLAHERVEPGVADLRLVEDVVQVVVPVDLSPEFFEPFDYGQTAQVSLHPHPHPSPLPSRERGYSVGAMVVAACVGLKRRMGAVHGSALRQAQGEREFMVRPFDKLRANEKGRRRSPRTGVGLFQQTATPASPVQVSYGLPLPVVCSPRACHEHAEGACRRAGYLPSPVRPELVEGPRRKAPPQTRRWGSGQGQDRSFRFDRDAAKDRNAAQSPLDRASFFARDHPLILRSISRASMRVGNSTQYISVTGLRRRV